VKAAAMHRDDEGKKRVNSSLKKFGMLLFQGQAKLPSVADLLAGEPVKTRGFSWDYVPAWDYCDYLLEKKNVEALKFFMGRRTLVHKGIWPAVARFAALARHEVLRGGKFSRHKSMLKKIESTPGIPSSALRRFAIESQKMSEAQFKRIKRDLESWLCILPFERSDIDYHSHDSAWFPWAQGEIERSTDVSTLPTLTTARQELATRLECLGIKEAMLPRYFPVVRLVSS
jgi:hypothetical protein